MKRSRGTAPGLKHLAFFEVLADTPHETPAGRAALAGLLALRFIDHWVLAGAMMVEPESVSVRSLRNAIMAIPANDPQRELLLGVVNTMQTLREVDVQPVLPRLFAYGGMLEKRGMLPLASDVYRAVVRHGDEEYDGDLVVDSHMRLGYCLRMASALDEAMEHYVVAGKVAKRLREPGRELRSRVGLANVMIMRGNLPAADELLGQVTAECVERGEREVRVAALHDRAVVARARGEHSRAVCLAYEALEECTSSKERERLLHDIAIVFLSMGRLEEARTALLLQEVTATSSEVRTIARVNMMALAVRAGDQRTFDAERSALSQLELPPQLRVNFLIESGRGARRFGHDELAERVLREAMQVARALELNRELHEAEEMFAARHVVADKSDGGTPAVSPDPAAHVIAGLRQMLASHSGE